MRLYAAAPLVKLVKIALGFSVFVIDLRFAFAVRESFNPNALFSAGYVGLIGLALVCGEGFALRYGNNKKFRLKNSTVNFCRIFENFC